jgi:hypothetical protein
MESSDLCKDAIRTCESCLMKFPDDTSLLKHIGLKKKCLERHNMGLVDPTIVQQLPSLGGPKAGGCEKVDTGGHIISFHSQQGKTIHPCSEDTGFVNSYATYSFPHHTNMGDSLYCMPPSSSVSNINISEEDMLFCNDPSSEDDQSWIPDNTLSEVYSSSNEEEMEPNIDTARDTLKSIADLIRRRNMKTFHLPTDTKMVMDLYQRIVGNGGSLNTFDNVLDWAFNHSLIGDHIPRRKSMLKQVSEAVYGKEFLKLSHYAWVVQLKSLYLTFILFWLIFYAMKI